MFDFTKLKVPTAKERNEMDERRRERTIAEDMGQCRERSRRNVSVTLDRDAECRSTMQGTKLIDFHATQALDGYWKPFKNNCGETRFIFIAQFIKFPKGPRAP
jgi:hypothetical protein